MVNMRRKDLGLGKTAAGGNSGSWAAQVRADAAPPHAPPQSITQMYEEAGAHRSANDDYRRAMEHAHSRVSYLQDVCWDDREDIVQDAFIELITRSQKHGWTNLSDESSRGGHLGVVDLTVKSMIMRSQNHGEHHTTVHGRKEFESQRDHLEQKYGRRLNRSELNDLSERVRLSYPPGKRPTAGYHLGAPQLEPLNEHNVAAAGTYEDDYNIGPTHAEVRLPDADLPGEPLKLKAAERREAQQRLWSDFARQDPDIPATCRMTRGDRLRAAEVLEDAGGVRDTALALAEGRYVSPQAEDAFYAPWGGASALTFDQQLAIAEKIAEHPNYAKRLWNAAMR